MPQKRMSEFSSIEAVQDWLLEHGCFIPTDELERMTKSKRRDYIINVYHKDGRPRVRIVPRRQKREEVEG